MDVKYLNLSAENISTEHICCAFSDKKCQAGYELKKSWLKGELPSGYTFRKLDERAKVFIEYGPAEHAWVPVEAPNYLMLGCFWVSGKYKGHGHAKALLQWVIEEARLQGKDGLVAVVGTSKFHFMSDGQWLIRQGFEVVQQLAYGFSLLALKLKPTALLPAFKSTVLSGECTDREGLTVYYSHRCPFTEYHVSTSLVETAQTLQLPLKIIHLAHRAQAQEAPTPGTLFSLFYKGQFLTTDVSACLKDKLLKAIDKQSF